MASITNRITIAANAVSMGDRHTVRAQLRTFFQTLERMSEGNAVMASLADHANRIALQNQIEGLKKDAMGQGWVTLLADTLRTRVDRACFQQESLRYLTSTEGDSMGTLMAICGIVGRGDADTLKYLHREVFLPLVTFYLEEVSHGSEVFRLLGLYKRRIEWFDARALVSQLTDENGWDNHLRRFLLNHGIANPFSQTTAARGTRQDITFYEDEHPIAIEIKYQDDKAQLAAEVAKGVRQAFRYADNLGSNVCYCVMFNKSKRHLLFEGSTPGRPYFSRGGIGIYCVAINLDLASPSEVTRKDAPLVLREAEVFASWIRSDGEQ